MTPERQSAQMQADDDREMLAGWMMSRGFSTGHGDTLKDLLAELDGQLVEIRGKSNRMQLALLWLAREAQGFKQMADPITHGQTNMGVLERAIVAAFEAAK